MARTTPIPWHRLLGTALADALVDRPYRVSAEEELALRSQRLDLLIIEQRCPAPPAAAHIQAPPDGLEDLTAHNLLSYKAPGSTFDAWALEELIGHYVTYRKLASIRARQSLPTDDPRPLDEPRGTYPLLPAGHFCCLAIATAYPRQLIAQLPPGSCQTTDRDGLYRLRAVARDLRLVVLNQLEDHPRNAPWGLFASGVRQRQALAQYRPRSPLGWHLRNLMEQLILGEATMAYTLEDMEREAVAGLTQQLLRSPRQIEQFLARIDPEERLKGLDPEERLKGLDPEERLKGLDPAIIEAWLASQGRRH